jgi:predicted O-methyltransferase YrrM
VPNLSQLKKAAASFPYLYSSDWVSDREKNWRETLARFAGQPGIRYLEVGIFQGRSAIWMLENVLTHPTASMVGLDTFQFASPWLVRWNLFVARQWGKIRLLKGTSRQLLPSLAGERFDFIYIDGSHKASEVGYDCRACWDMLAAGGVLLIDDYGTTVNLKPEDFPKPAVDAFLAERAGKYKTLKTGFQLIVEKTA